MILLSLKLNPSVVAGKYILFQVLRSCLLVALLLSAVLLPVVGGLVVLVLFVVVTLSYYLYLYRLILCIFTLAQKAEEAG